MKSKVKFLAVIFLSFLFCYSSCKTSTSLSIVKDKNKDSFLNIKNLKEISISEFKKEIKKTDNAKFSLMNVKTTSRGKYLLNKNALVHQKWLHSRNKIEQNHFKLIKKILVQDTIEFFDGIDIWYNMYAIEFYEGNQHKFTVFVDLINGGLYC